MADINYKKRRFKIRIKQKRREKIKKLVSKYKTSSSQEDKDKIIKKLSKIAPHLNIKERIK